MNQELIPFDYNGKELRIVLDGQGNELFVAKDVCAILEIKNVSHACSRLDEDEKTTIAFNDSRPGYGAQSLLYVTLPGLFKLTFRSTKKEAKDLYRKVTHEILPAIHKTGSYSEKGMTPSVPPLSQIEILKQSLSIIESHEQRLQVLELRQQSIVEVLPTVQQITPRLQISKIARAFADKHTLEYRKVFNDLYREFKYRYSVDLKAIAEHKKTSPMQIAEEQGKINQLLSLTVYMFVEGNYKIFS
jgi:prophage antirepressor-like protein